MNSYKTVLITGSSKNLGAYLTKYYLNKEFRVIGISKKSKSEVNKNTFLCDLSSEKKTLVLFKKLKKKYRKIDLIISCAGASKKTFNYSS